MCRLGRGEGGGGVREGRDVRIGEGRGRDKGVEVSKTDGNKGRKCTHT